MLLLACAECPSPQAAPRRVRQHRPQERGVHTAATSTATAAGSPVSAPHPREYERSRLIERQLRDIAEERPLRARAIEILLDIRQVEGGDDGVALLEELSDGADGLRAAEVTHDGHEQIARLKIFHRQPV